MRMHLGAQHFRDDDSFVAIGSATSGKSASALIVFLFLGLRSLCYLLRARRACPPFFRKGARPRTSHDRDTTPLHRTFGEANLERCACAFCGAWETADKREGAGRAACTPASHINQNPCFAAQGPKMTFEVAA